MIAATRMCLGLFKIKLIRLNQVVVWFVLRCSLTSQYDTKRRPQSPEIIGGHDWVSEEFLDNRQLSLEETSGFLP